MLMTILSIIANIAYFIIIMIVTANSHAKYA